MVSDGVVEFVLPPLAARNASRNAWGESREATGRAAILESEGSQCVPASSHGHSENDAMHSSLETKRSTNTMFTVLSAKAIR